MIYPFARKEAGLASSDNIEYGMTKVFTIDVHAPTAAGTYTTNWQMKHDGNIWFGDKLTRTITVNLPQQLGAQIVDHDIPDIMSAGQSYTVHIRVMNTGTDIWTRAKGFTLSAVGGSDPFTTITSYELSPSASVSIRQTTTFVITMKAPSTPGPCTTDWQMTLGGVGFGDGMSKLVEVRPSLNLVRPPRFITS